MNFQLPNQTTFKVGDYVDVYGERYYINYSPIEKQHSSIRWEYSLDFQAIPYDLIRAKYFGYSSTNELTEPVSDLIGTASTFIDLIIANANRNQSGWVKGDVDETETITLQFSDNDNCLSVLSQLAEKFKTEYWIEGKTIHLTKKGEILNTTLSYEWQTATKAKFEIWIKTEQEFEKYDLLQELLTLKTRFITVHKNNAPYLWEYLTQNFNEIGTGLIIRSVK